MCEKGESPFFFILSPLLLLDFLLNHPYCGAWTHEITLLTQILELEKHFREQQVVSGALENALGPNAGTVNFSPENPMPKVTTFHPRTYYC
jgi:hypothetical protein